MKSPEAYKERYAEDFSCHLTKSQAKSRSKVYDKLRTG